MREHVVIRGFTEVEFLELKNIMAVRLLPQLGATLMGTTISGRLSTGLCYNSSGSPLTDGTLRRLAEQEASKRALALYMLESPGLSKDRAEHAINWLSAMDRESLFGRALNVGCLDEMPTIVDLLQLRINISLRNLIQPGRQAVGMEFISRCEERGGWWIRLLDGQDGEFTISDSEAFDALMEQALKGAERLHAEGLVLEQSVALRGWDFLLSRHVQTYLAFAISVMRGAKQAESPAPNMTGSKPSIVPR